MDMAIQVTERGPTLDSCDSCKYHAVFAYNRSDHDTVVAIRDELTLRGITTWIDSHNHRPGSDWRKGFKNAIKNSPVVVVFFGPNGTGRWQEEEIPWIHNQRVTEGKHVIPVVLPDGKLPEDMIFATHCPVEFRTAPIDINALDSLEFGITGHHPKCRLGRFEILAEVEHVPHNCCFLAVSHATSSAIYDLMVQSAIDAGLVVAQPREFSPDAFNVYTPDVVMAIRSATVIVADGTPNLQTRKPDADVMYEVGLAQSLAKPIVFVSTPPQAALPLPIFSNQGTPSYIEYDPCELNYAGPLREQLADSLRKVFDANRPPGLIRDNTLGITVAYSEVHQHRGMFWQPFEQIMHFGLTIKKAFGDILKFIYRMQQVMSLAHAEAVAAKPMSALESHVTQFHELFSQFCRPHVELAELSGIWVSAKNDAARGFDALHAIAAHRTGESTILPIVQKARQFFDILDSYLQEYCCAYDVLLEGTKSPPPNTLRLIIQLHSHIQRLAFHAEMVPIHACEMMFQLLGLIGMRQETGESKNAFANS